MTRIHLATLLAVLISGAPATVFADHNAPLPATIEERVCTFIADIDDVIADFGFIEGESPNFGDERLNRALVRARHKIVESRSEISYLEFRRGFRLLAAGVKNLEKGARLPVSGNGFADDLASLLSFRAETFTEDLLALAALLGAASPDAIAAAELLYLEGNVARSSGIDAWQKSIQLFGDAIDELDDELILGPLPCS
jgi:hypothetical protein